MHCCDRFLGKPFGGLCRSVGRPNRFGRGRDGRFGLGGSRVALGQRAFSHGGGQWSSGSCSGKCFGWDGRAAGVFSGGDLFYRRANLEHAAAAMGNIMQGTLLVFMLSLLLLASYSPAWTFWGVHPVTPFLFVTYIGGMALVNRSKRSPMWKPVETDDTRIDELEEGNRGLSLGGLWMRFSVLALILGVAGWAMQYAAAGIVNHSGLNAVVMGVLFTSVATSLPELVTSVAAVRRGALTLAVSGILGGNAYDSLFAAFSDVAYRAWFYLSRDHAYA